MIKERSLHGHWETLHGRKHQSLVVYHYHTFMSNRVMGSESRLIHIRSYKRTIQQNLSAFAMFVDCTPVVQSPTARGS